MFDSRLLIGNILTILIASTIQHLTDGGTEGEEGLRLNKPLQNKDFDAALITRLITYRPWFGCDRPVHDVLQVKLFTIKRGQNVTE